MNKWKMAMVSLDELEETSLNANKMSKQAFNRLVENIRISGGLSSAIGCYRRKEDGKFVIFSGNHRKKAAEKLRIQEVPVVYAEEEDLSKDEITALQLSHNSLHGEDDDNILKQLLDEIQQVDFKEFAFVSVDDVIPIDTQGVSFALESEHYSVYLVFYRNDFDTLKDLFDVVDDDLKKGDMVILADGDRNEDEYWKLAKEIGKRYKIKSTNTTFAKMMELAKKQMELEGGIEKL